MKLSTYIKIHQNTSVFRYSADMLPMFWYFGPQRNQNESRHILTPKSTASHRVAAQHAQDGYADVVHGKHRAPLVVED